MRGEISWVSQLEKNGMKKEQMKRRVEEKRKKINTFQYIFRYRFHYSYWMVKVLALRIARNFVMENFKNLIFTLGCFVNFECFFPAFFIYFSNWNLEISSDFHDHLCHILFVILSEDIFSEMWIPWNFLRSKNRWAKNMNGKCKTTNESNQ